MISPILSGQGQDSIGFSVKFNLFPRLLYKRRSIRLTGPILYSQDANPMNGRKIWYKRQLVLLE